MIVLNEHTCKDCEYLARGTDKKTKKKYKVCKLANPLRIIPKSVERPEWCPLDTTRDDIMKISINNWLW